MILNFKDRSPQVGQAVFIAPDAWVIGAVELADQSSVFFGSVLRGDINPILIGRESNIQDFVMIHTSRGRTPTVVEERVSVGHRATLHGCRVCSRSLVGMGAIILDEAIIGEESLIAAGAVVTEGKIIPPRSLVMGVPGRVVRTLSDSDVAFIEGTAEAYLEKRADYLAMKLG